MTVDDDKSSIVKLIDIYERQSQSVKCQMSHVDTHLSCVILAQRDKSRTWFVPMAIKAGLTMRMDLLE